MEAALREAMSVGSGCTILALYCDFDIYDRVNLRRKMKEEHVGTALVSVPCLAKIKAIDLLRAFEFGAEGVQVIGCPSEECTYQQGEVWARRRVDEAKMLLAEVGVDASRLELHYISGLRPQEFDIALAGFSEKVRSLSVAKE